MSDQYMTPEELRAHWKVSRNTLLNYRKKGIGPQPVQLLPGQRGLRYVRAEVLAYDAEQKRAAGMGAQAGVQP